MTDYRDREIGKIVSAGLAEMPVAVIAGMRQTGKSTLLRQPLQRIAFIL
jgi:predicted AAA+ superfamily ATPase